ncbi:MAG: hypothetical protein M3460_17325 [Actinomycetota bacterium]|nr:hypothetical protein [Actinomycetota bacterium]
MTQETISENVDWIDNINLDLGYDLPELYSGSDIASSALTGKQESMSLLAGKMLIITSPELTAQQLADVQNSQLLCQLVANKQFDDIKQPYEWYNEFRKRMSAVGWLKRGDFHDEYKITEARYTLSGLVIKILESLISGPDPTKIATTVKKAIDKITQFAKEGHPRAEIFSHATTSVSTYSFAMGYAYPGPQGAQFDMAFFSVKMGRSVTNALVATFESQDTETNAHQVAMQLNESFYANKARKKVLDKLGDKTKEIDDWPI